MVQVILYILRLEMPHITGNIQAMDLIQYIYILKVQIVEPQLISMLRLAPIGVQMEII
ncbi:hypothetical protein DEHRE_00870 [Dehalobacter restrictus DSM 9455]|uniref:Uncharacterized protein n=1 Tax=Dehalobacter restrictus (strain DSM 9455 / PER-K23) TaxID=871738 RepID=A0ABM5P9B0_DEHRP|nr:hypothetical protein DEHRE_00870 [Dehalobacter restrictus DSM 9455]